MTGPDGTATELAAALMEIGKALAPGLTEREISRLLTDWLSDQAPLGRRDDAPEDLDPAARTRRFLTAVRDELLMRRLNDQADAVTALIRVSYRGMVE